MASGQPDTSLPSPKGRESQRGKPLGVFLSDPPAAGKPPHSEAAQKKPRRPQTRNPWAERKAAEPKETPAWIWTLLGAIDPILGADGCVWSDPTPEQPSYRMFCIGKPDPQQPRTILLDNGMRLPIGTHLWEHGPSLRINDGTKVADIPLSSRFRSAVLSYLGGLIKGESIQAQSDPHICDGKLDPVPHGLDASLASVTAFDDFGGAAAMVGMQLYREITCNPEAQSSVEILSLLGKVGGRGPVRAKPNLNDDRFAAPQGKPRGGSGNGDVAEHLPPRLPVPRIVQAPVEKFRDYIFKPGATHGKAPVFESLGYRAAHSEQLSALYAEQAAAKVARGEYTLGIADGYGQRITIPIELPGIDASTGRLRVIQSGWMVRSDGSLTLNTPFSGFVEPRK